MVPFLKNSLNFKMLNLNENDNFDTECFSGLISALNGGSIEDLRVTDCNIDDISALGNCMLPHLKHLSLSTNNISSMEKYINLETLYFANYNMGKEGCKSLAKMLQNPRSCLNSLELDGNDMGGEAAEIIANSLKNNTTLEKLELGGYYLDEVGKRAFLKVLNDVSSIERTYKSNHTLSKLLCPRYVETPDTWKHIFSVISINEQNPGNSHAAGRSKVIATQLNSTTRMELCRLQGIEYSYSAPFADIDPVLLPDVLVIVGGEHDQSELYRMLIATVANLASTVDKKACIKENIAENTLAITALDVEYARKSAALAAMHLHLQNELASMESEEVNDPVGIGADVGLCGRKRSRIGLSD